MALMKTTVVLLILVGHTFLMSGVAEELVPLDITQVDRVLEANLEKYAALGPDIDFLQTSNNYTAVFSHNEVRCPQCPGRAVCRCGIYSFQEAQGAIQALGHQAGPNEVIRKTVEVTDSNTFDGIENCRKVFNLQSTARSKTVSSVFSTDPALNVLTGTKGVLKSLSFYQRIMTCCFGVIESLIKCIKEHYQPMTVAQKIEITTLKCEIKTCEAKHHERITACDAKHLEEITARDAKHLEEITARDAKHLEEITARDAKHLEESAILLGQIKLDESNHELVIEENRALKDRQLKKKARRQLKKGQEALQRKQQAEMNKLLLARIAELESQLPPMPRAAITADLHAVGQVSFVLDQPSVLPSTSAPPAPVTRRIIKAVRAPGAKPGRPAGSKSSQFFPRKSTAVTEGGARSTSCYRRLMSTDRHLEMTIDSAARNLLGKRPRPDGSDPRALSRFRAMALVSALDKPLRAAVLDSNVMKADVEKLIKRRKVYEQVLRHQRKAVRNKRKSAAARFRACVQMGSSSGSVKGYAGLRSASRAISGEVSALPTLREIAATVKEIFDACTEDFKIYPLPHGHALSLRPVIEAELLNFLTGEPTRKRHVIHKTGGSKAAPFVLVESKTMDWDSSAREATEGAFSGTGSYKREWQDRWTIKITWDGRQVAVDRHQVEVMLLLIPRGVEGQNYNQSCLRIRTVMVLVGKDSQANVQANFEEMLKQASEIAKNGMRYSAEKGTFMGQVQQTRTL